VPHPPRRGRFAKAAHDTDLDSHNLADSPGRGVSQDGKWAMSRSWVGSYAAAHCNRSWAVPAGSEGPNLADYPSTTSARQTLGAVGSSIA